MTYRVSVTTQVFPPHREVPGLTDVQFSTFEAARHEIRARFRPYRARPVPIHDEATLARWVGRNLADGRVVVAIKEDTDATAIR